LIQYNGITKTLSEWARDNNVPVARLKARVDKLHWGFEKAISAKKNYL